MGRSRGTHAASLRVLIDELALCGRVVPLTQVWDDYSSFPTLPQPTVFFFTVWRLLLGRYLFTSILHCTHITTAQPGATASTARIQTLRPGLNVG